MDSLRVSMRSEILESIVQRGPRQLVSTPFPEPISAPNPLDAFPLLHRPSSPFELRLGFRRRRTRPTIGHCPHASCGVRSVHWCRSNAKCQCGCYASRIFQREFRPCHPAGEGLSILPTATSPPLRLPERPASDTLCHLSNRASQVATITVDCCGPNSSSKLNARELSHPQSMLTGGRRSRFGVQTAKLVSEHWH
ncbi:hypothetical protein BC835DRAFT_457673 [Cytidiella melzeri]|nr:hypothetical protein BC835DRAFT_457673 [Cytidiella melzeri]